MKSRLPDIPPELSLIEYPSAFPIKVMGAHVAGFTEAVIAAKGGAREAVVHETADLWFHCLVMLAWHDVRVAEVLAELERREGRSGHDEKASRPKGP